MKKDLLDILACPVCKHHPLDLNIVQEEGDEVMEGALRCSVCNIDYPIEDSIPNLLPPDEYQES